MSSSFAPFQRYFHLVDDWDAFQDALKRPLPTTIWTNTRRITPARLASLLAEDGIPAKPLPWYPGGFTLPADVSPGLLWQQFAGLYHIQEATSMMPVRLLNPQPGERVLDMCAAPGNKTAQIATAMKNTGTVIATDVSNGRLRVLRQTINHLGLTNIAVYTADAANISRKAGQFDRILVDAPCSCEGTTRRSTHLLEAPPMPLDERKLGTQVALLRKAVQLCKPGGRIVYATCTYAPEENELVVDAILREVGDDTLQVRPATLPGVTHSPGLTTWQGKVLHPSLAGAMRLWPHQNDSGGFFVAVLDKLPTAAGLETTDKPITAVSPGVWGRNLEPDPWLAIVCDRFGINPATFEDTLILRWSRRGVFAMANGLNPMRYRPADNLGMFFMRTTRQHPKLTTGAAMAYGAAATQNLVALQPEQLASYFQRDVFEISADQLQASTGLGYVLVTYKGVTLGTAVYFPPFADKPHRLESLYPKTWTAVPTGYADDSSEE